MTPAMGQGSSCMGGAWRALAEPPWMLALDPDPTVCNWEMSSSPTSTAAKHGDHQPHFGVWIVLEALERHRARNTLVQQSIHPCCATGTSCLAQPILTAGSGSKWRWPRPSCCQGQRLPRRNCPRCRLPWSQGSGKGRYSPSASSHRHRTPSPNGQQRSLSMGQQKASGLPIPHVPPVQGDVTGVTQLGGVSHYRWGHQSRLGLGQPQWAEADPKPIRVAEGQAETRTTPQGRSTACSYLLLGFRGHVLLQPALEAGSGAAQGVCHRLCPAGTAAGPPPQPHHGPPTGTQHHGGGVETAPCPGERRCWHGAAMAASQCTHWCQGMSQETPEPSPLHAHSTCTHPSLPPQHSHPPFYPQIPEFFWKKPPCSSGSEVCNPVCWVLPVSTWSRGEHSAGELALIRHSALGQMQHLAMA